jgi:cell division protein FtsW (lipid II flippase)
VGVAALYDHWAGHFSVVGFALGLVVVVIIYGWAACIIIKAMRANNVAEAQRQTAQRSLMLMGIACLIFVPTLLAFASF